MSTLLWSGLNDFILGNPVLTVPPAAVTLVMPLLMAESSSTRWRICGAQAALSLGYAAITALALALPFSHGHSCMVE